MITFDVLFSNVILFALLMIPGWLLGKLKGHDQGGMTFVSNILTDIALPFLVFSKLIEIRLTDLSIAEIVITVLISIIIPLALYGIALAVFRNKDYDRRKLIAERFCSLFPNCGFLGIPLAEAIYPHIPKIAVLVSLYNVFSTFMLLTLGIYVLSGSRQVFSPKKLLFRPIHFAIVFGVIFSLVGITDIFPMAQKYTHMLSQLTTPLSMTVLGFELSKQKLYRMFTTLAVYKVALLKLVVSPFIALFILLALKYTFIPSVGGELVNAMIFSTGVSTAATASSLAASNGIDSEHTAQLTLGNTILCTITLPVVCIIGGVMFGL